MEDKGTLRRFLQEQNSTLTQQPVLGDDLSGIMNHPKRNPLKRIDQEEGMEGFRASELPVSTIHHGTGQDRFSTYDKNIKKPIWSRRADDIEELRAKGQSRSQIAGNALGQAVIGQIIGGTLANVGYLFDIPAMTKQFAGTETEWGENWLSQIGNNLQKKSNEEWFNVYQTKDAQQGWAPWDKTWWGSMAPSIFSSASLLIPVMGTTQGIRLAGKVLGIALKPRAANAVQTLGSAFASRHMYGTTESYELFNRVKEEYMREHGKSEKEARELAGEAASHNYKIGYANLWKDAMTWGMVVRGFNHAKAGTQKTLIDIVGKKGATNSAAKKIASAAKGGDGALSTAALQSQGFKKIELLYHAMLEGVEEYNIQWQKKSGERVAKRSAGLLTPEEEAKSWIERLGDHTRDRHTWDSFFWGMAGGLTFGSITRFAGQIANKTRAEQESLRVDGFVKSSEELQSNILTAAEAALNEDSKTYGEVMENSILGMGIGAASRGTLALEIEMAEMISKMSPEQLQQAELTEGSAQAAKDALDVLQRVEKIYNRNMNNSYGTPNDAEIAQQLTVFELKRDMAQRSVARDQSDIASYEADAKPFSKDLSANGLERAKLQAQRDVVAEDLANLKQLHAAVEAGGIPGKIEGTGSIKTHIDTQTKKLADLNKKLATAEENSKSLDAEQLAKDNELLQVPVDETLRQKYLELTKSERTEAYFEQEYNNFKKPETQKEYVKKVEALRKLQLTINPIVHANSLQRSQEATAQQMAVYTEMLNEIYGLEFNEQGGQKEFKGQVQLSLVDSKGNTVVQQLQVTEVREDGTIRASEIKDGRVQRGEMSILPDGTIRSSKFNKWTNYEVLKTAEQVRREERVAFLQRQYGKQIKERKEKLHNVTSRTNQVEHLHKLVTDKISAVAKTKSGKVRLNLKDQPAYTGSMARKIVRKGLEIPARDLEAKASIALSLTQLEALSDHIIKNLPEIQQEVVTAKQDLTRMEAEMQEFADSPTEYKQTTEAFEAYIEATEQQVERTENVVNSLEKSIRGLKSYLKGKHGRLQRLATLQKEKEALIKGLEGEAQIAETPEGTDYFTSRAAEESKILADIVAELENSPDLELLTERLALPEAEKMAAELHLKELQEKLDAYKTVVARRNIVFERFESYYENTFKVTEESVANSKTLRKGDVETTFDEQIGTREKAMQPFGTKAAKGTVGDLSRTSVSEVHMVLELKGQNNNRFEPQLLFQKYINDYLNYIDEKKDDYRKLQLYSGESLLAKHREDLTADQVQYLEEQIKAYPEVVYSLIVNGEGTAIKIPSILNSERKSILFATLNGVNRDKDGTPINKRFGSDFHVVDLHNRVEAYEKQGFKSEDAQAKALKEFQEVSEEYYETVIQPVLENPEGMTMKIAFKTPGSISHKYIGTNTDVQPTSLIGTVVRKGDGKSLNKIDTVVAVKHETAQGSNYYPTTPGHAYVYHKGRLIKTQREKLSPEDIDKTIDLLRYAMTMKTAGAADRATKLINELTYMFFMEKDGKESSSPYRFFIKTAGKGGKEASIIGVQLGDTFIPKHEFLNESMSEEYMSALRTQLQDKYYNLDTKALEEHGKKKDYITYKAELSVKDGKVESAELVEDTVYKYSDGGYQNYLYATDSPKIQIRLHEDTGNTFDQAMEPQILNRSLQLKSETTTSKTVGEFGEVDSSAPATKAPKDKDKADSKVLTIIPGAKPIGDGKLIKYNSETLPNTNSEIAATFLIEASQLTEGNEIVQLLNDIYLEFIDDASPEYKRINKEIPIKKLNVSQFKSSWIKRLDAYDKAGLYDNENFREVWSVHESISDAPPAAPPKAVPDPIDTKSETEVTADDIDTTDTTTETTGEITSEQIAELKDYQREMFGREITDAEAIDMFKDPPPFRISQEGDRVATAQERTEGVRRFKAMLPDSIISIVEQNVLGEGVDARFEATRKYAKTLVSRLAAPMAEMHEAWHNIELLFMTPTERASLHTELRTNLGNKLVTVQEGDSYIQVKGKDLTTTQASEFIAEEFRYYNLQGATTYKFGQNTIKRNMFQRIWDALISMVLGKDFLNRKNIKANPDFILRKFEEASLNEHRFADRVDQSEVVAHKVGNLNTKSSNNVIQYFNQMFFTEVDKNFSHIYFNKGTNFRTVLENVYKDLKTKVEKYRKMSPQMDYVAENWSEITVEHAKYLRQYNIVFDLESVIENIEQEKIGKDNTQMIESNRINVTESMPNAFKLLIAGLSDPKSPTTSPRTVPFSKTVGIIHREMADLADNEAVVNKLIELSNTKYPEFKGLLQKLGIENSENISPEGISKEQFFLQNAFFVQLHKSINDYVTGIISEDGKIYMTDAIASTLERQMMDRWKNNLKAGVGNKISLTEAHLADLRPQATPEQIAAYKKSYDANFKKVFSKLFTQEGDRFYLNHNFEFKLDGGTYSIRNLKVSTFPLSRGKPENLIVFTTLLNAFGMTVSPKMENFQQISEATSHILSELNKAMKLAEKVKRKLSIDDIFNRDVVKANKELKDLIALEAKETNHFIDNQIRTSKGTEYSLMEKSRIAKTLDTLNAGIPEMFIPFDPVTGEGSIRTVGSLWHKYLSDGKKIGKSILRNVGKEVGDKTDINKAKPGDLDVMHINSILTGNFPYLRAAERGLEYAFGFGKDYIGAVRPEQVVETFKGYLQAELLSVIAFKNDPNLKRFVKGKNGENLFFFENIVDAKFKKELTKIPRDLEKTQWWKHVERIMAKHDTSITKGIQEYFADQRQQTLKRLIDNEIISKGEVTGKTTYYTPYGISPEVLSAFSAGTKTVNAQNMMRVIDALNYHTVTNFIEQSKYIYGDPAIYTKGDESELFKRSTLYASTTGGMVNHAGAINYMNTHFKRFDGSKHGQNYKSFTYKDNHVASALLETVKNVLPKEDHKFYEYMSEDDAGGRFTLDGGRAFDIRAGLWNNDMEKTFQHQAQFLGKYMVKEGRLTAEEFKEKFAEHLPENADPNKTYFEGNVISVGALTPFGPRKPQGTGMIQNPEVLYANRPSSTKTGMSWMLPTDFAHNKDMMNFIMDATEQGMDAVYPHSARKSDVMGDLNGNLASFYKDDGSINLIGDLISEEGGHILELMDWTSIGNQLDLDPSGHTKVTKSTQKRRLEFVDMFHNGHMPDEFGNKKILFKEATKLERALVQKGLTALLRDTGLQLKEGSETDFNLVDSKQFQKTLVEEFNKRTMPDNLVEGIDVVLKSAVKVFDTLPTKRQVVNVLQGMVRSKAISIKVNGDSLVQQPSTGFETSRAGSVGSSNFLKFYRLIDKNGEETSDPKQAVKVAPAQVMVSLPTEWVGYIERMFVGDTFEQKLDTFNKNLSDKNSDVYKKFHKILHVTANRIPSQNRNSSEAFEIVKFLSPAGGPRIVLPTEIVAKTGSDYDIDKLTTYFNNITREHFDGESFTQVKDMHYIEYDAAKPSKQGIENRLNEIYQEVLLDVNNYASLIKPNNSEIITNLAKEIRTPYKPKNHELLSYSHNAKIAESYWQANALVSLGAIHTTSHSMTQINPITVNSEFMKVFFDGLIDDKSTLFLGHLKDQDGNFISDNLAAVLTAAVDAQKEADPSIYGINLTMATGNAYLLLNRLGGDVSPTSLAKLAHFFTLEPIMQYDAQRKVKEATFIQTIKGADTESKKATAARVLGIKPVDGKIQHTFLYELFNDYVKMDRSKMSEGQITKVQTDLNLALQDTADLTKKLRKKYASDIEMYKANPQLALEHYLYYLELGKVLGTFQTLTKPDAAIPKDRNTILLRQRKLNRLIDSGIIDSESIQRFFDNSFIGEFKDVHDMSVNMFKDFYLTEVDQRIKDFIWNEVVDIYDNPELNKPEDDVVSAIQHVENSTVSYILHTTPFETIKLNSRYQELAQGKNSVAKRTARIQSLVKDNMFLDEITPIIGEYIKKRDHTLDVDYLKTFNRAFAVQESNDLTSSIRELLDHQNQEVREYARDLIEFGLIQSGVQSSYTSFFEILPSEYYHKFTSSLVENYIDSSAQITQEAKREIFANLSHNRDVVPLQLKAKLSGDKSRLKVSKHSQNSQYPYLVVEEQIVSDTEADALRSANQPVPRRELLYERAGEADNNILYQRIPNRGVQARAYEAYGDSRKSTYKSNTQPTRRGPKNSEAPIDYVPPPTEEYTISRGELLEDYSQTKEDDGIPKTSKEKIELAGYIANMQLLNEGNFDLTLSNWLTKLSQQNSDLNYTYFSKMIDALLTERFVKKDAGGVLEYVREFAKTWFRDSGTGRAMYSLGEQRGRPDPKKLTDITPDTKLNESVNRFLKSIGVQTNLEATQINDHMGRIIGDMEKGVVAVADISNRTVDVIKGRADVTTLPEEAAHFYVAMLPKTDKLYKAMMRQITKYDVFAEVVQDYSELYNNDQTLLKEEAIGKVLASEMVKQHNTELSADQTKELKTWWTQLWNYIKDMFSTETAYKTAALEMMNNNIQRLVDVELQTDHSPMYQRGATQGRLEMLDDVYQARKWQQKMEKKRQEYIRKQKEKFEMDKIEAKRKNAEELQKVEVISDMDAMKQDIFTNFGKYFPDLETSMTQPEIIEFVNSMTRGELEVYC